MESSNSDKTESESSSDDFDMSKPKPRKEKVSAGEPKEKKPRAKSPENEQGTKVWCAPKLPGDCVFALALFQFENETASTTDIKEFLFEEFPFYKTKSKIQLKNLLNNGKKTYGILDTGEEEKHSKIVQLNRSKCATLKSKLEKSLTENEESIKVAMARPQHFRMFLQNVRVYVCTEDVTAESKPDLTGMQLILDTFGGNFGVEMTISEIASKIGEKYSYYAESTEQSWLKRNASTYLRQSGLFSKRGPQHNLKWKLDPNNTGLCHSSRIASAPKPIQILMENSKKLFLLGNPSGKVGNFYFEDDDPAIQSNSQSLSNIAVTMDTSPGKFKIYMSWMSCLEPKTCPFGEECFNFIFGHSDMEYCSLTQSVMSIAVKKRKPLLPSVPIPVQHIDLDNDEESGFDDCSIIGQWDGDSEPSDNEQQPFDKISDFEDSEDDDDENYKKKPRPSCKGPLDFLLRYPNHEFRKQNCLSLWTTNNRKLKRPLKYFLRYAYKDMSTAKGMYPQMTREAYGLMDSLRTALPFRKKYIIRAKAEGRLSNETIPQFPPIKNVSVVMTKEEFDKLTADRQLITKGEKGETVTITIKEVPV